MAFSQSDSEGDLIQDNVIIRPYDYQPQKKKKTVEQNENTVSEEDVNDNPNSPSIGDVSDWCKCDKCETALLVREKEFCCCKRRGEKLTRHIVRNETGKIFIHCTISIYQTPGYFILISWNMYETVIKVIQFCNSSIVNQVYLKFEQNIYHFIQGTHTLYQYKFALMGIFSQL